MELLPLISAAGETLSSAPDPNEILEFLAERLRVQLRAEGSRYDVLDAVFAAKRDDDLIRLLARADAVEKLLGGEDGTNLLTAYRRATNILRIEDKKDGPHQGHPDETRLFADEEVNLFRTLRRVGKSVQHLIGSGHYIAAMREMAGLRAPVDAFFDKVTVNAPEPELRRNRLRLLAQLRDTMNRVADFSKIEG